MCDLHKVTPVMPAVGNGTVNYGARQCQLGTAAFSDWSSSFGTALGPTVGVLHFPGQQVTSCIVAKLMTCGRFLTAFPGSCGKRVQALETLCETSINPHESQLLLKSFFKLEVRAFAQEKCGL